jgi:polyisoprenoid-binding protein YceI
MEVRLIFGICASHQLLPECEETMSAGTAEATGYVAGTWDIDPVHSHVGFVARHLMVSKVRGNFTTFEGQIVTTANALESSAVATIDTTSLATNNAQRDEDVKGENFLDVANYPTMTYKSTAIRQEGDIYVVTGDLTIKGVTRPVELTVEVNGFGPDPFGGTRAGFSASGEINRNDYGITANMALPTGGVVVSEKIQLTLEVEAVLKTA